MKKNNLLIFRGIIIFFTCFYFLSCIYHTDEISDVTIQKPENSHPASITLTLDQDSLIIYKSTIFNYDINTFGEKFTAAKIKFLDVEFELDSQNSSFTITPSSSDSRYSSWFDVTIDYYFSTGSGSLADKFGLENYKGSKTWKVKYVDLYTFDYKFNYRVGSDSIFEIYWIRPDENVKPSIIQITTSSLFDTLKVDRIVSDTVFYKDRNFLGGDRAYYIRIAPFASYGVHNTSFNVTFPAPELKFTDVSPDSCIISCTKSVFRTIYQLVDVNKKVLYQGNTPFSYKDIAPAIGDSKTYCVYCYRPDETIFESSNQKHYNAISYSMGKKLPFSVAYAKNSGLFYLAKNTSSISSSTYPLTFEEPLYHTNLDDFQTNSNGTLKAGRTYTNIYIYDKDNVEIDNFEIPYYSNYYNLIVADNNTLGYYDTSLYKYIIKNYGTDNTWSSFSFNPHFNDSIRADYPSGITGTADGKYVMCKGDRDFNLFDVSNHTNATLIFSSKDYKQAIENAANKNEIVLLANNKIEVRSLPDMSLLRQTAVFYPRIILLNVDPYSHILAYSSSYYIVLMNIDTMQEIARFRTILYFDNVTRLFRKQLITDNKKILDLNNFLP